MACAVSKRRGTVALYESEEWGLDLLLVESESEPVLELQDSSWVLRVVLDRRHLSSVAERLRQIADRLERWEEKGNVRG